MSQENDLVSMLLLTTELELQTVLARPANTGANQYYVPSLNETHTIGTTIFLMNTDRSKIRDIAEERFQTLSRRYKLVKKNFEEI